MRAGRWGCFKDGLIECGYVNMIESGCGGTSYVPAAYDAARWRSGNAGVCKTSTQGFDSPSRLSTLINIGGTIEEVGMKYVLCICTFEFKNSKTLYGKY